MMMMNIEVTSPDSTADSETESLVVHANGDSNLDDLLSECETDDVEIESNEGEVKPEFLNHLGSDPSFFKRVPRTKTRLLSRSHSASDLTTGGQPDRLSVKSLNLDPPRRNSSGEYPASLDGGGGGTNPPSPKDNVLLQDIELPKYKNNHIQRNSLTPSSNNPITMQYATTWRTVQPQQDREDEFSLLLQTTAERVLNRLKSREQDLGCALPPGQKYQRKMSHTLQPPVPRKLPPILRDGNKTPRSESDLRSIHGESDLGPLSAA